MAVVGLFGFAMVPVPEMSVQTPVAGEVTELPCMVYVLVGVHNSASGPAFGGTWLLLNITTTTSSVVMVPHEPLLMVHRNVFVPNDRPETVVVGEEALANVPEPFTKLQLPVAGNVGVFPTNDADVVGKQND